MCLLTRVCFRFSHVFTRTRNRLQFLSDFPADDDAEMIASLEVKMSLTVIYVGF